MPIRRMYVEKNPESAVEARHLLQDLRENLGIHSLEGLRLAVRYDVEGLDDAAYAEALWTVFAEPPLDQVFEEALPMDPRERSLAIEYLPGQYDQRADSAAQCLQILTHGARPMVACARVHLLLGDLSEEEYARIRSYLINPVDSREAHPSKPNTLAPRLPDPSEVSILQGFRELQEHELPNLLKEMGLAMTLADLQHTQRYFSLEARRDPTETELRLLDTYWSDHCRHTTFLTRLTGVSIEESRLTRPIRESYALYQNVRAQVFGNEVAERPECLMDLALLPARALRRSGRLEDQEITSEINACSIVVEIDHSSAPGGRESWLLMFKNETHNHPTEIEPFGGAATCLGGAIRDPLSGRAYVYQSMRITGSGDPRQPVAETLPGKLPQRKITQEAAHGFSAYGNQIGLATGQVVEYYDPGYVAKRMEIGAVIGAVPRSQVRREEPLPGDVIVLIGGRTGRDGIGGATGSSKAHTEESIETCGAEVQKGDPPMERKLQRLFRRPEFSRLVKKCNDFGAGGISVAIGELAEGLEIHLDAVPKKYEGLNGTELALSESQERMAVVVAPSDLPQVLKLSEEENLEATQVAEVRSEKRLRMTWKGQTLVDLDRSFLDSNGASQFAEARILSPELSASPLGAPELSWDELKGKWLDRLSSLDHCSQRGLVEKFDSTIGASTVLLPFGGRFRRTPAECMVAKFPVRGGTTRSASAMSHGFLPALSRWSPFHGAVWAHVLAASRLASVGADPAGLRFTLQEYFGKPLQDPLRWGSPLSALLGAFHAQLAMETPAIGGKDSMSGSYKDLDVPPTLVAFAVSVVKADEVSSPELKTPGHRVVLVDLPRMSDELPRWSALLSTLRSVSQGVREGKFMSVKVLDLGGLAPALSLMTFGNHLGLELEAQEPGFWLTPRPGAFVLEMDPACLGELQGLAWQLLGHVIPEPEIRFKVRETQSGAGFSCRIPISEALEAWEDTLEPIFPTRLEKPFPTLPPFQAVPRQGEPRRIQAPLRLAQPKVLLTVFPGTNCEYDTEEAFLRAGAQTETLVFRNLHPRAVEESLEALTQAIRKAQILMIPGGFSAGDEPEGSGKFIATVFRNPQVRDAVHELLQHRDGLILGICNGFQALIKLGLVPYGEIREQSPACPTLSFNALRYTARMAWTRVVSNQSPWMARLEPGALHTVAIAHGEGRIVGSEEELARLLLAGQVPTQYVDGGERPTMDLEYNPNGSALAIESLSSPDGRVLGKMAHAERYTQHVWKNVPGEKDMELFRAGVEYFTS